MKIPIFSISEKGIILCDKEYYKFAKEYDGTEDFCPNCKKFKLNFNLDEILVGYCSKFHEAVCSYCTCDKFKKSKKPQQALNNFELVMVDEEE